MELLQSSQFVEEEWTVTTFDSILAYIGGYMSIVWAFIGLFVGGYQSFRFEAHLMKSMYTEENYETANEEEVDDD